VTPEIILSFDFGTRRIGVASGDTLTRTARGLKTFERAGDIPWAAIGALVAEYRPGRLVIGVPYNMDGTPTLLTDSSRAFARELRARFGLPACLMDERLSSREAQAELRDARAALGELLVAERSDRQRHVLQAFLLLARGDDDFLELGPGRRARERERHERERSRREATDV